MTPEVATPPLHSRRVQAWIYAILNPVTEGLQRESYFLAKGNITWQSDTKRCEYIRPIREYFPHSQYLNYEDFLTDPLNPGFKERFEDHDRALSAVEASAVAFADELMQIDEFQKLVKDSLGEYQSAARTNPLFPYLDDSPSGSRARGVAALLINRADDLPQHYGTHKFWELYKRQFEIYRERPSFRAVSKATQELKDISSKLFVEMESHRQLLCRAFDIPAAPIPPGKSQSTDAFNV